MGRLLTYPKRVRLLRKADFTLCYEKGLRWHTPHFLLFVRYAFSERSESRTGMAVSKKVGKAVVRNRIRRLLREFFRLHGEQLPRHADIAVVAKKHAAEIAGYRQVEEELLSACGRLPQTVQPGR
ncbi:MAG: ribonuclease P protein component [Desulfovibrio sp.]|nr:ribonuclease P protein component [Desulfovibrio sp.]